jgi:hypothetical protein
MVWMQKSHDPAYRATSSLYAYMTNRLMQANIDNDPAIIDEVAQLLITVKSGWDAIADAQQASGLWREQGEQLQRFDETRDACSPPGARDWEAIGELDESCRALIDEVLKRRMDDVAASKVGRLAAGLPQLLDVTMGERQAIADEMTQINQAKNASKVYHLFS